MKYLTHLLRLFLGITFIISGMIKLNDPMGFSFKLEDYFAPNVLGLPFLIPFALTFAIFVCIVEVVLGVMLLVGYQKKLTLWSLLAMLIFFGFLTFYSAYFNKVTDYQRHSAISGCPHHLFMGTGLYKTHQQRQTTPIYHPTIGNFLQCFCILCI